jgi:hypothetical protein
MQLVHEFDDSNWQMRHRLALIKEDGTRLEGDWALYAEPAILSGIEGNPRDIGDGFLAYTEYWEGVMPPLVRFYKSDLPVLYADVTSASAAAFPEVDDEGEADDETFALKA